MNNPTYTPIDCNFYDELVLRAMRRQPCQVVFQIPDQSIQQISTIIQDLVTRDGAEFLILKSGEEIRLDYLIAVDGKQPSLYC